MGEKVKTVAIVGAGVSGICSAKAAKLSGFLPTVFDKAEHIGGVWSPAGLTWSNMHTNVGNHIVSLSDFPWPQGSLVYPNSREVYQYLLNYIKHFGIEDRFRLDTTVETVKLLEDERWQIKYICNGQTTVEDFDYCVIANGFNSYPHVPEEYEKGRDIFKGLFLHSADYHSNDDRLKDKKVIVIGNSFSAVEIAGELAQHAGTVTNLFKNPYLVLPKIARLKTANDKVKLFPVDAYDWSRRFYYALAEDNKQDIEFMKKFYSEVCPVQTNKAKSNPALFVDLEKVDPALLKASLSEVYIDYVNNSKINAKQGFITSFRPDGVLTDDGTFIEADAIFFCTSYHMNFPFFDQDTLNTLNYDRKYLNDLIALYKNTWHPDLPNLGFVGLAQSGIFIVGDLQAKWIFKVFKGERSLPPRDEIKKLVADAAKNREINMKYQYPYSFVYLCDTISAEAGLLDLEKLKKEDPEVYEMVWSGPVLPEHFQLNDPETRDAAIKHIKLINANYSREYDQAEADAISVNNFI